MAKKDWLNVDVNYPGINIELELVVMTEYLTQMEADIQAVCDEYIKEEEKNHDGERYYEYQHIYRIAEDEMPRIIRMPFLISIYTLFENSVTQLLAYAQEKENKTLKLRDIRGKSLSSRFNKYLAHVINYDFQFDKETLSNIKVISKIRNCIAHANGNLISLSNDKVEDLKKIAKDEKSISIVFNQLDISHKFLQEAMNIVSNAIKDLMVFMEEKYGFYT